MVRLALVGGVAAWHGGVFASLYNGFSEEKYQRAGWAGRGIKRRVEGAQIVKVWDEDEAAARVLADACDIPTVCGTMEEALSGIDGVIITDDMTMTHQRRAVPFLTAGIPAFIDKPLSQDPGEAREIVQMAKEKGVPLLSCSALRYAKEVEELKRTLPELGPIALAVASCTGDLVYYGIHALELAYAVMGAGVSSVINVGRGSQHVVRLRYKDGRQLMLLVGSSDSVAYGFELKTYAKRGAPAITVKDAGYFYWNQQRHFVDMIRTGQTPILPEETLEIIQVLRAATQSARDQSEISLVI